MNKILLVAMIILLTAMGFAGHNMYQKSVENVEKEILATDYLSHRESYENDTAISNKLIEKYNNPELLTFDRVDTVNEYVKFCDLQFKNLMEFEKFIYNNSKDLKELGLQTSNVILDIESSKRAMSVNKQGMKKDLKYMLNSSPIIGHNKEKYALAESLVEVI